MEEILSSWVSPFEPLAHDDMQQHVKGVKREILVLRRRNGDKALPAPPNLSHQILFQFIRLVRDSRLHVILVEKLKVVEQLDGQTSTFFPVLSIAK